MRGVGRRAAAWTLSRREARSVRARRRPLGLTPPQGSVYGSLSQGSVPDPSDEVSSPFRFRCRARGGCAVTGEPREGRTVSPAASTAGHTTHTHVRRMSGAGMNGPRREPKRPQSHESVFSSRLVSSHRSDRDRAVPWLWQIFGFRRAQLLDPV